MFDRWPCEKRIGVGDAYNIGAVRLPAKLNDLLPFAAALIEGAGWETRPDRDALTLDPVFVELVDIMFRGYHGPRARR